MATTKIWAVKDSLSRVVNYASNPEKTVLSDLEQVLLYAENKDKTAINSANNGANAGEKTMFVTGINCNKDTAYEEMTMTQKRFDKCTGNIAYHAYQSFKTGEVTPELAHKIGVELAEKMWEGHQVIVATHFNTGTYHNHFVCCSVNMFTGKKFNCNKGAYYRFRGLSDELCEKYELSVIKNPKGRTPRNIYFAEKRGEPTKYNVMRKTIDEVMETSLDYRHFKSLMLKRGYIIQDGYNLKYPTIRSINDTKAVRLFRLGEQYIPYNISRKIQENIYYGRTRRYEPPKQKKVKYAKLKGSYTRVPKLTGIEMLILCLLYLLGIIHPKSHKPHRPLSPEMREEVRKLERYSRQVRLVSKEKLETVDDVKNYISDTTKKMNEFINIRQKYRNKLRNCKDDALIAEYKSKIGDYSKVLKELRYKVKIANQIIEDVPTIKEVIRAEKQFETKVKNLEMEKKAKIKEKER